MAENHIYASTVPAAVERLKTAVDEWNTGYNIDRGRRVMAKKLFFVTETDSIEADDWRTQRAVDAEQAAELYAERLNQDAEDGSDDRTFDLSVKDAFGEVKRFTVYASLSWSYSATEKGDAL